MNYFLFCPRRRVRGSSPPEIFFLFYMNLVCVCGRDLVWHSGRHRHPVRHHQCLCHCRYLRLHPSPCLRLQVWTLCRSGPSRGRVSDKSFLYFGSQICDIDNPVFKTLDKKIPHVILRCMMGYVNASLSVFRVSDFENRSQPMTNGSEFIGEAVKYCRYSSALLKVPATKAFSFHLA